MALCGVIFDLDGTLVDSALDFAAMRVDLGFPPDEPILEALERIPPGAERDRCLQVLRDHELRGARRASLIPGVAPFLAELGQQSLKTAVLTRNSRECTVLTLRRLRLEFELVLTREDAPPKPDPAGLLNICQQWGCQPHETIYIGDFLYDIQAGRNAGIRTALYAPDEPPDYAHLADHTLTSFHEAADMLRLLAVYPVDDG